MIRLHRSPLMVELVARARIVAEQQPVLIAHPAELQHKVEAPSCHVAVRQEEDDLVSERTCVSDIV